MHSYILPLYSCFWHTLSTYVGFHKHFTLIKTLFCNVLSFQLNNPENVAVCLAKTCFWFGRAGRQYAPNFCQYVPSLAKSLET